MKSGPERLRLLAGVAVLLILVVVGFSLIPSYMANWKLQRFVSELVETAPAAASPDSIRTSVVNKAASLGLPVRSGDVRVEASPRAVRVEVLYAVRVDVAGYTVDLHFRPSAETN